MSDTAAAPALEPAEDDPRLSRNETVSVVLLGLAATLTAVTAYLSGLAGGEEAEAFTNSNLALTDANFFYNSGNQTVANDRALFISYLEAVQSDQDTFFLTELMSPNLQDAIAYWEETEEALTPFDEGSPYVVEEYESADAKQAEAEAALQEADDAGAKEEKLELANVVFAMALFAAGIVTIFKRVPLQGGLLALSAVMTVVGTVVLITALG